MCKPVINYDSSTDPSSSSSSSRLHSLITTHSLSTSSSSPFTRCTGLNLLVKAIHQITAGSVIGVPYFQKRIITRRRRSLHFTNLILTTSRPSPNPKPNSKSKLKSKGKRQRRVNSAMPLKYRDSVLLQSLVRKPRSERSLLISGE